MTANAPLLELRDAVPSFEESGLMPAPYNLRIMPGECAVIDCRDFERAAMFADLCSGMISLTQGSIKFMGLDWSTLRDRQLNALRGRIGRISRSSSWLNLFGTHLNIMLPHLYHTTDPFDRVVLSATELGHRFGFPGLPTSTPDRLSGADLARAACVRAFVGRPDLLVLEDISDTLPEENILPFLEMMTAARDRGCGVLWFVRSAAAWHEYRKAVNIHMRLLDEGLFPMRVV
ncbi:ABC transporter ATP-binding protein [Komagataeibacter intermedius]|uniref:ABC transporter ATP-binding protein n=2 Tax=Komagataeibacter intermedius TaxID=66229 RepID=A0A0N1FBW6_9PROT|nr:ABC transporter ATP-binding protein [Komagataeibacter intermedius]KPH87070.1 ABC transporter ATP-binding protein [Komagataeibacter intermedius AF2]MCF3636649.1 ABC transporter ATP-binding protein [Komagataeibacter intermedius]GAN88144.1 ABC transporter [Komagataeibacter intermedius TF2]GBQ68983.1 ABC transporter ATP-binding protein [Komagataeibacter intermedius NRIC 0521]